MGITCGPQSHSKKKMKKKKEKEEEEEEMQGIIKANCKRLVGIFPARIRQKVYSTGVMPENIEAMCRRIKSSEEGNGGS